MRTSGVHRLTRRSWWKKSIEDIDESIELHRPYVDDVHLTCPHCGKPMTRIPEVMDCWFDSGSMPFAQQHYPFENTENFRYRTVPGRLHLRGHRPDQRLVLLRCWQFPRIIKGQAPYKNVLVNDLILDKERQEDEQARGQHCRSV